MNQSIRIKPDKGSLFEYIDDFEKGKIQVPAFQRDFVWDKNQKLDLWDSIEKGYPIGSILLWQPDFNQKEKDYQFQSTEMASYTIPKRENDFFYILDGFQRLSTLIGCLVHPEKTNLQRDEEQWQNDFNIVYDLQKTEDRHFVKLKKGTTAKYYQIPIYQLIDAKAFFYFQRQLYQKDNLSEQTIDHYLERYEYISKMLQLYEIPAIKIYGGTLSEAVDIFQRLNSKGAKITTDWVVSALSFNQNKNFELGKEISNLLTELKAYNFQNEKRETILNCIINSFDGIYFDISSKNKQLEKLARRADFPEVSRKAIKDVEKAVEFLFNDLFVLEKKLLPYSIQLIFISDFFRKIAYPTDKQKQQLIQWFYQTTYSNYFTSNLSQQRLAYQTFQKFIKDDNINPFNNDHSQKPISNFPKKITMKSVRAKASALFMLKFQAEHSDLDMDLVDGYKAFLLFKSEENTIENTILVIKNDKYAIPKSKKDLSEWLKREQDDTKFFLTTAIKTAYKNNVSPKEILVMRKALIIEKEKEFVEHLGFTYNEQPENI